MMYSRDNELRWRFTAYIEKVIIHARIDYLRAKAKGKELLYLEELAEEPVIDFETQYDAMMTQKYKEFQFEEERFSRAFSELSLIRRRILELLFIDRLEPHEIAEMLHCSRQYVYDQKYKALRQLREALNVC
ncbi:MAG: sigma-70 family RNA polymerase sigma factor [Oscillospiraceae bacterium]|nr:sigma-70 family RNA polymerase sigma factor [Oscillospiraceae bacterium]